MWRWSMRWPWALGAFVAFLACSSGQGSGPSDSGSGGRAATGSGGAETLSGGTSAGGLASDGGTGGSSGGTGGSNGGTGGSNGGTGGSNGSEAGGTGTGSDAGAGGSGTAMGGSGDTSVLSLGMNDVTILAPLPENGQPPVLLLGSDAATDGTPFVPKDLVDRLTDTGASSPALPPDTYERLNLIAVRFDLCDHNKPGPCPLTGDASLRLVFQPLREFGAEDVGFHAFYSIAPSEVSAAIQALVELSELNPGPAEPLTVSVPLSNGDPEYAEKLRAFVRAYGGESRLVRLTMNAQPVIFASITWLFRGVERKGSTFEEMLIVDTTETTQQVRLGSDAFFDVTPVSDAPQGLALALNHVGFRDASETERDGALEALVAVDNPLTSAPDNVACVGCHTSSVALATRSADMGIDPRTLPGRFETSFDVSINGGESATLDRTLRALGWIGTTPLISQRVANDTALALEDLARWVQ